METSTLPATLPLLLSAAVWPVNFVKWISSTNTNKINNIIIIIYSRYFFTIFPQASRCFWIITTVLYYVVHWHYYINVFCIIYLFIIYFAHAIRKWSTILKYYFFISIISRSTFSRSIINVIFPLTTIYASL